MFGMLFAPSKFERLCQTGPTVHPITLPDGGETAIYTACYQFRDYVVDKVEVFWKAQIAFTNISL